MKQKTWIISALMCAMVIMVCLGVLHLLKEMTENNAPSGTVAEESTDHTEPEIDFAEEEETKEDIAETGSEEEESDVPVEGRRILWMEAGASPDFSFCSGGGSL